MPTAATTSRLTTVCPWPRWSPMVSGTSLSPTPRRRLGEPIRTGLRWPITKLRLDLWIRRLARSRSPASSPPRLQVTSEADLVLPWDGTGCCRTGLPRPGPSPPRACAVTLPPGQCGIWLHLVDLPQVIETARRCAVSGAAQAQPLTGNATGKLTWKSWQHHRSEVTITLPADAGPLLDAVVIAEGATPPQDRPVIALQPVTSTVRPVTPKRLTLLRRTGRATCWPPPARRAGRAAQSHPHRLPPHFRCSG